MAFKVLDWVRKVRDEKYLKCKDMNLKDKIKYTKEEAKEFSKKYPKETNIVSKR